MEKKRAKVRSTWVTLIGPFCGRTQGSKPLNIAVGNVQSFEINGCTVLSLPANRKVVGGNCMISKASFVSKL